ncbi:ImmA/IrrE family metallo-endopeptidase [Georgenia sp. 10Sc9-8]|uniref:ImmA/IrrE family metallo-endopeptidase n=1 Tax=Georgenia halotolerans TaxID=3028317 RepID=A0ABT5U0L0_9MICO|nr:ImmA/IrrE family metallo-endopeptidase [Georgenia halotolerans]
MLFHPWRRLRQSPHIDVAWWPMAGRLGATNGRDVIVLHPGQSQVLRRCTVAHELAHVELGHTGGCTGTEERHARQLAARWLITMEQLLDALRWSEELQEVAEELWVDTDTLNARLDALTAAGRAQIVALYEEIERAW